MVSYLNTFMGKSLITLSQKEINAKIVQNSPGIDVRISYSYPATIKVVITDNQSYIPVVIYQIQQAPSFQEVMSTESGGILLSPKPSSQIESFLASQSGVPALLSSKGDLGSVDSKQVSIKLTLIIQEKNTSSNSILYQQLKSIAPYFPDGYFYYWQGNLFVKQEGKPDLILDTNRDINKTIWALKHINSLENAKKGVQVIDLRYENPILK